MPLISPNQYESVVGDRQAYDSSVWQAPVLSLTAQAFLLTISLAGDTAQIARILSSVLSVLVAFASTQLLSKHREAEVRSSLLLERFEEATEGFAAIHTKWQTGRWFVSLSSYKIWRATLVAFGLVSLVSLVLAIACPNSLATQKPLPASSGVSFQTHGEDQLDAGWLP